MKTRFLIIGHGIIGKAVFSALSNDKNIVVDAIDKSPFVKIPELNYEGYSGIVICLPTPEGPNGECDDSLVKDFVAHIRIISPFIPILIKSTISIELIKVFEDDISLTYNPEFLTEVNALEEFKHQKFTIFGGNIDALTGIYFWHTIFINCGIKMDKVKFTSMKNAGFAKYVINSFLATKVIFFNELRKFYHDDNFDELIELISLDERIGDSHMMVPGPDLKYGFGGKCFPKDTRAFVTSAENAKSPLKVLEKVIEINKGLRGG
jgi:UDPglucose 6-dehydrogenase